MPLSIITPHIGFNKGRMRLKMGKQLTCRLSDKSRPMTEKVVNHSLVKVSLSRIFFRRINFSKFGN